MVRMNMISKLITIVRKAKLYLLRELAKTSNMEMRVIFLVKKYLMKEV